MLNCVLIIMIVSTWLAWIYFMHIKREKKAFISKLNVNKNPKRTDSGTIESCSTSFQAELFFAYTPPCRLLMVTFFILKSCAIFFLHLWMYLLDSRFQGCKYYDHGFKCNWPAVQEFIWVSNEPIAAWVRSCFDSAFSYLV